MKPIARVMIAAPIVAMTRKESLWEAVIFKCNLRECAVEVHVAAIDKQVLPGNVTRAR